MRSDFNLLWLQQLKVSSFGIDYFGLVFFSLDCRASFFACSGLVYVT